MRLLWVRRVVDDFPAALRVYRPGMSPVGGPAAGEPERWEEHGWVRLGGREANLELELVARDRFVEVLGSHRVPDDVTLVFGVDDLPSAVADLRARGAELVVEPREEGRLAQVRDPAGMLVELVCPRIESWGSILSDAE